MKSFVETVVGGAIGLAALYVVGKIAFQLGRDCEAMETKLARKDISTGETSTEEQAEPARRQSKLGLIFAAKKLLAKNDTVLGKLVKDPEAHRLEAYVQGDELQVRIKPRSA